MLAALLAERQRARAAQLAARTDAWRLCDQAAGDPLTVDWYAGHAVVQVQASPAGTATVDRALVAEALGIAPERVFVKERRRQRDRQHGGQYAPLARRGITAWVREDGLRFLVNLSDYLDTGLFLDHRPLRARIREEAAGKRVLNLFCYTASFTVHAAAGGARASLSLDLSRRYLRWAARNFAANAVGSAHRLLAADAVRWLAEAYRERFDLIVCDPPTFSNSARMAHDWEVQRDHPWLLWRLWNLLAPGGTAYFSTNRRDFALREPLPPFSEVSEITEATIDLDFAGTRPHRCWRLRRAALAR
ncbi:MAG: class I SAM-dependent methyltransferase [Planctomycetota bacterium]|nr:class I SAM-dependent methyltransferase [Planctomycetota bacterium]MCX8038970.1 class I SAM-dependent methyltransferase [Planctomycetota bacterium]MDW8372779.1 class I SAM-dependent methyltransferase [Planctomycetota bacterium]